MKKRKKRNCNIGYSCGYSCISIKLKCKADGLKGQAIKLANAYFAKTKAEKPVLTDTASAVGEGVFGQVWIIDNKAVKKYFDTDEALLNEVKAGNQLANDTLAKDGLMPKVLSMGKRADGKFYTEQEALIGYKSGKQLKQEGIQPKGLQPFIDKLGEAMAKYQVLHNDIHLANIMLKLDDTNTVTDAKLIDADLMGLASSYRRADLAIRSEQRTLQRDILGSLT